MIDTSTHERLYVSTDGGAGPYLMVPVEQLGRVRELLDRGKITYWIDEEVISLDGAPEIAFINLGRSTDTAALQQLLDSVP